MIDQSVLYTRGMQLLGGDLDWQVDDVRVLLASPRYEPHLAHDVVGHVAPHELAGQGYERKSVPGRRVATVGDRVAYLADAVEWTGLNLRARYRWIVLHAWNGADDTSPLLMAMDAGEGGVDLTGLARHAVRWGGASSGGRLLSVRRALAGERRGSA